MNNRKATITDKMSESSDQDVPEKSPGKPALGTNIKDTPEAEVKKAVADKMSESAQTDDDKS